MLTGIEAGAVEAIEELVEVVKDNLADLRWPGTTSVYCSPPRYDVRTSAKRIIHGMAGERIGVVAEGSDHDA